MAGISYIYQIWIDSPNPPSEDLKALMLKFINLKMDYRLISTSNYFEGNQDVQWSDVSAIIEAMLRQYPFIRESFGRATPQHKTDIVRAYLATECPNGLYADCDIELVSMPVLTGNIPRFIYESPNYSYLDAAAFADNGGTDTMTSWFVQLLKYMKDAKTPIPYNKMFLMLNEFKKVRDILPFDPACFVHHRELQ